MLKSNSTAHEKLCATVPGVSSVLKVVTRAGPGLATGLRWSGREIESFPTIYLSLQLGVYREVWPRPAVGTYSDWCWPRPECFWWRRQWTFAKFWKCPKKAPYLLLDERIIEDTHSTWSQFLIVKELVGDKEKALALVAALSGPWCETANLRWQL